MDEGGRAEVTVVYADLTFLLNAVLNYLVLCCTAGLTGLPVRRLRPLAAASLGGLYAVLAAVPAGAFLAALPGKCAVSLLMVSIALGRERYFLRRYLLFLAASCTLSGACVGSAAILRRTDSPWVVFLVSALFCAFVLAVVFRRCADPGQAAEVLTATITCGERSVTVPLLRDTGNTLRDPDTGQVVCVVWERALEPLGKQRYRKLPFQSLGQEAGELACFTCQSVTIGGEVWRDYPIGVSPHPLSAAGGYVGLWGGERKGAESHGAKTA